MQNIGKSHKGKVSNPLENDGSMSDSGLVASWVFGLFLGVLVSFVKLASIIHIYKILILFFMTYKNKYN